MPTPGSTPPQSEFMQPPRQAGVRRDRGGHTYTNTNTVKTWSKNQCVHRGSFALISSGACEYMAFQMFPNKSRVPNLVGGGRNR